MFDLWMSFGYYEKLFDVEFRNIDGAIIVVRKGLRHSTWHNPLDNARDRCLYEHQENHEHFSFRIGKTPYERWQNNLLLARCVQRHWLLRLKAEYPEREFISFIWNEIAIHFGPVPGLAPIEVDPKLHLWSRENDPKGELAKAFYKSKARRDVLVRQDDNYEIHFHRASEAFTKGGEFRKAFLRKFKSGMDSIGRVLF